MSYVYDVMVRVYAAEIRPLLEREGKDELAYRFENLIEAMHSANHEVPSADGVFKGDGINKDRRVTKAAHALDEAARALEAMRESARERTASCHFRHGDWTGPHLRTSSCPVPSGTREE